jgi:hypothetical protein
MYPLGAVLASSKRLPKKQRENHIFLKTKSKISPSGNRGNPHLRQEQEGDRNPAFFPWSWLLSLRQS